ncbi:MAG: 50S ribosomal protein L30 [Bradymonadales bacterium]|nr:50S ribosomal protein L30 [Bradymonadales bacterium]
MAKLKITQRKSTNRCPGTQVRTMKALGLKKMHQSVIHDDTPTLRGMLFQVKHLVEVEEVPQSPTSS